jgi:ACS family tartrate transporter-like MFS transporter
MTDERLFAKCAWRLLPLLTAAYVANYLDRTNLGFAALTMNRDLGFSSSIYGLGAGIFFLSYSLLMVPSNLVLYRVGARRWIFFLLLAWGAAATANAFIRGPESFYGLRFLLGVAEAGFFPGIIFYLTLWFPKTHLVRANAVFMCATSASLVMGGPLASLILGLDGVAGIRGWQWLFVLEGLPSCLMALAVLRFLPDGPARASWLTDDERQRLSSHLNAEDGTKEQNGIRALRDPRVLMLGVAYAGMLFAAYGFNFWLPLLVQGMGFSTAATGPIVALVYLASLPAMIVWGRSSDRRGDRIWHVALAALFAAAALLVASALQSTFLVLLALAAATIAVASMMAPFYGISSLFLSGPAMASGYGLVNTLGNLLGGFGGQYAIGLIREQTGGYAAALVAIATTLVFSALLVLAVGRAIGSRAAIGTATAVNP